jgi:hypothetical protein
VFNSVTVDEEIRPDRVTRSIQREECVLNMYVLLTCSIELFVHSHHIL